MGACFTLIFEGCPLKINATATWVNPLTKGSCSSNFLYRLSPLPFIIPNWFFYLLAQMIIFGTNDGIYYLNLQELADATLELVSIRNIAS